MRILPIALIFIFLSGCGAPPTTKVALRSGFRHKFIQTAQFNLASYQKITQPGKDVTIYIEGDGHAWVTRSILSKDPSPRTSLVMQLAALDPSPNVVYLARPCQFSPGDLHTVCKPKFWSKGRYSPAVILSINSAVSQIKQYANAKKVHLIGYSGGGALAVLVAAKRKDIASIRTVAGNLDLITMDRLHRTSPLTESVDPISVATQVRHIPQIHFSGAKDKIVPTVVAQNFVRAANLNPNKVVVIRDTSHNTNWQKHWRELLKRVP